MDDDVLLRHRIRSILMDQIRASGGTRRKKTSSKTRNSVTRRAGSKVTKRTHSKRGHTKRRISGGAMKWITYVKKYAKEHNITYPEALRKAGPSYRKLHGSALVGGKNKVHRKRHATKRAGSLVGGRRKRKTSGSKTSRRKKMSSNDLLRKLMHM